MHRGFSTFLPLARFTLITCLAKLTQLVAQTAYGQARLTAAIGSSFVRSPFAIRGVR